jgi:hypothetical protein
MIINVGLKKVSSFVPLVGSAYSFGKTCFRVYNATSPTKALIIGVKGVVIDCTPPYIKYPLLCTEAILCGGAAFFTGDPNFAIGAFECCNSIIEG